MPKSKRAIIETLIAISIVVASIVGFTISFITLALEYSGFCEKYNTYKDLNEKINFDEHSYYAVISTQPIKQFVILKKTGEEKELIGSNLTTISTYKVSLILILSNLSLLPNVVKYNLQVKSDIVSSLPIHEQIAERNINIKGVPSGKGKVRKFSIPRGGFADCQVFLLPNGEYMLALTDIGTITAKGELKSVSCCDKEIEIYKGIPEEIKTIKDKVNTFLSSTASRKKSLMIEIASITFIITGLVVAVLLHTFKPGMGLIVSVAGLLVLLASNGCREAIISSLITTAIGVLSLFPDVEGDKND